jgi:hypothetical protein
VNIKGKDIFFYSLTGVVLYVVYRMTNYGESASEAAIGFWDGLTGDDPRFWEGVFFDSASMGPSVQLTEGARASQADWIKRGFLEITPEGGTRITPAGEAYVQQQQEKIITGQVVN